MSSEAVLADPSGPDRNTPAQPLSPIGRPEPDIAASTVGQSQAWRKNAECRGVNPDIFFPRDKIEETQRQVAAKYCAVCVVKAECLDFALSWKEGLGVWGGMTEAQRRRLIRERKQTSEQDVS
ncbi:WhiB family transcriptional regulator [Candidatus Microgenomates bacterium]|nr:WhiB family transcriptional regulator [Candidatus Microgenomates bacterium]